MAADAPLRCALERQASLPQTYTHGRIAARSADRQGAFRAVLLLPCEGSVSVVSVAADGSQRLESCLLGDDDQGGSSGHPVTCVAIAPQGLVCGVVATRSGHCFLFDLSDLSAPVLGKTWRPFGNSPAVAVIAAFDPSGTLVALGSADGAIRIVDTTRGFATHAFQLEDSVGVSALYMTQDILYVGADQGRVTSFDLVKKKEDIRHENRHTTTVTALFPALGESRSLLSLGRDRILKSSSLENDQADSKSLALDEPVDCASLLRPRKKKAEEQYVAVGDATGMLTMYDWTKGVRLAQCNIVEGEEDTTITEVVVLSQTSKTWQLACSTGARTIVFVTFDAKKNSTDSRLVLQNTMVGNIDEVYDVSSIPGTSLLCLASNSHAIRVVDMEGIQGNSIWPCVVSLEGHSGIVLSIDCSAGLIASSSRDKRARVWKYVEGEDAHCIGVADGHSDAVGAVALSNGRSQSSTFVVTGAADRTVKLWPLDNALRGTQSKLTAKWTVLAHDKDINCIAIAPDDRLVASGSQDKTIRMWDVDSGKEISRCTGHRRGIWSIAFSSVDRVIASASGDHTIRVWSVKTGSCLRTFEGHSAAVLKVIFGPRGTSLFSSDSDGIIKAWSVRLGECTQTVDAHGDRAWSLALVDDGGKGKLVSAGADATVHSWVDMSDERNAERQAALDDELLQDHAVEDAIRRKKWRKALQGAIELDKPRRMFSVMNQVVEEDGPGRLCKILGKLVKKSEEWTRRLLGFCKDWNASNSSFMVSQIALKAVFEVYSPSEMADLFGQGGSVDLVEALVAYTGRHYKRLDQADIQVSLVDFILQSMKGLDNQIEPSAPDQSPRESMSIETASSDSDSDSDEEASDEDSTSDEDSRVAGSEVTSSAGGESMGGDDAEGQQILSNDSPRTRPSSRQQVDGVGTQGRKKQKRNV